MGSAGETRASRQKGSREGLKELHRGRARGRLRVSQHSAASCWGSAIWQKRSLEEAEPRGVPPGRQMEGPQPAENRDWRLETGREREGRPRTGDWGE